MSSIAIEYALRVYHNSHKLILSKRISGNVPFAAFRLLLLNTKPGMIQGTHDGKGVLAECIPHR